MRNRGSLTAWVAAALVALAVGWLFLAPWHGPIIVSLSDTHGIDLGDLPAVALIAFAVAGLARAREPRPSAAGRRRAVLGVSAAAAALGVLLLLAGTLHTFTPPALLPAGGGTFDGDTEHADSGRADPIDHWSHVAVTYDGATIRLYLDGRPVSSRAMHGQVLHTNEPLWIGGNHPYGEYFDGDIDEVRVYDRALTALQIRRTMSTPIARGRDARTAGLIGAYALDSRPTRVGHRRLGPRQQRRDPRSDLDPARAIRRRHAFRRQRRRRPCPGFAVTRPDPRHDAVGVDPAQRAAVGLADHPPPADRRVLPGRRRRAPGREHDRGRGRCEGSACRGCDRVAVRAAGRRLRAGLEGARRALVGHNRPVSRRVAPRRGLRARRDGDRAGARGDLARCARARSGAGRDRIRDRGGVCGRDGRRARRAGRERSRE